MTEVQQAFNYHSTMQADDPDVLSTMAPVSPSNSTTDVSIDAVSSLRAAALSSLRMKRKRVSDGSPRTTSLLRAGNGQPPTTLDYGTEEPSMPINTDLERTPAKDRDNLSPSAEDIREEGEISDEEEPPSIGDSTPQSSEVGNTGVSDEDHPQHTKSPPSMDSLKEKTQSPSLRLEDSQQRPLIDEHHVRPGLTSAWFAIVALPLQLTIGLYTNTVSIDQLNMTKELVLDLLGWGVSPEYLVECGLTRHAIFYAFTELNLKLPKNLDVSGIDPYPFPRPLFATVVFDSHMKSEVLRRDASPTSRRPSTGHPLPAKPVAAILSSTSSNGTLRESRSPSDGNDQILLDIEAQKRQELLARRAVIASRKKPTLLESTPSPLRNTHFTTSTQIPAPLPSTHSGDPIPGVSNVVPLEKVDDFLNSMISESLPPPKFRSRELISSQRSVIAEPMDVDNIVAQMRSDTPKTALSADAPIFRPGGPKDIDPSSASPSRLLESPEITVEDASSSITSIARHQSVTPSQPTGPLTMRRGTKRPVASDFVDLEVQPLSRSSSSIITL